MDSISNISGNVRGVNYSPRVDFGRIDSGKPEDIAGSGSDESPDTLILGNDNDSGAGAVYTRKDIVGKMSGVSAKSDEEKAVLKKLQDRDAEVRRHEMTHASALGTYAAGSPQYTYEIGPDGRQYAVGGSIAVDVGSTGSASADKTKAMVIQMAAVAVGNPSPADLAVASMVQGLGLKADKNK